MAKLSILVGWLMFIATHLGLAFSVLDAAGYMINRYLARTPGKLQVGAAVFQSQRYVMWKVLPWLQPELYWGK